MNIRAKVLPVIAAITRVCCIMYLAMIATSSLVKYEKYVKAKRPKAQAVYNFYIPGSMENPATQYEPFDTIRERTNESGYCQIHITPASNCKAK